MKFFNSPIGRLRIIAFAEGVSLLLLVFVAIPLKYGWGSESLTSMLGAIHGALFLLFIFSTIRVSIEEGWRFGETTWKVLLACLVPFGTFYVDQKILKPIYEKK